MTGNALAPFGPGISVTPTSLQVTEDLAYDDFERALTGASHIRNTAHWWIGDLLVYGEARYGERYAQVVSMSQMSERTVKNCIYVCSRVVRSRRNENLSFSHHREVAPLESLDQSRLLGEAEREDWSVVELREAKANLDALRRAQEAPPPPPLDPVDGVTVDAVRGVSVVRSVLVEVAENGHDERAAEALRALEDVQRTVREAAKHDRLHGAVAKARAVGRWQTGLPDPAVIIPGSAWQAVEAAHDANGGAT